MWYAIALMSPFVLFFSAELLLRVFVSGRIKEFIENVPPLGLVQSNSSRTFQQLDICNAERQIPAICFTPCGPLRGVVIYSPELHGNKEGALRYCEALLQQGIAVIGIDFCDDANSIQAPNQWVTQADVTDLEIVIEWLRQQPEYRTVPLGLFGVSRSGAAAITAAWRSPEIRVVVTESAFTGMQLTLSFVDRFGRLILPDSIMQRLPAWHIRAALRLAFRRSEQSRATNYLHLETEKLSIPTRTLLISGKRDSYVGPKVTEAIAQILNHPLVETWIVPKAKHNRAREVAQVVYDQRLAEFFCSAFDLNILPQAHKSANVA